MSKVLDFLKNYLEKEYNTVEIVKTSFALVIVFLGYYILSVTKDTLPFSPLVVVAFLIFSLVILLRLIAILKGNDNKESKWPYIIALVIMCILSVALVLMILASLIPTFPNYFNVPKV